jgi:hypothetical protein
VQHNAARFARGRATARQSLHCHGEYLQEPPWPRSRLVDQVPRVVCGTVPVDVCCPRYAPPLSWVYSSGSYMVWPLALLGKTVRTVRRLLWLYLIW